MNIEDIGYNPFFEASRKKLVLRGLLIARVTSEHRGAYWVRGRDGECLAKITGKRMFQASSREDYPAVGDWVAISALPDHRAVIHAILPRQTIIKRKYNAQNETQVIAANVDIAFVVESVDRDYNLNRFERYFAIAKDGGVQPAIILNKVDLATEDALNEKKEQIKKRFGDIDFILTSTKDGEGLVALREYIEKGKTYCFLGSSGVGKSSIINALLGGDAIRTGSISAYSGRGQHVTTRREMYFLENGGMVIDNPGMREVGVADIDQGIDDLFEEITTLAGDCKYIDCTHAHEPGCAVLAALAAGRLDKGRYMNYFNLKKEVEYYKMSKPGKREKERRFGKFIKKAKETFKKYGK